LTHFAKLHGLGNDYLVLAGELPFELTPARAELICHRNLGLGSDGILVASPPQGDAASGLRIINPDGSEAEKSGNGIRIFSRWLWDTGRVKSRSFSLSTLGGRVEAEVHEADASGRVEITANMGKVTFQDVSQLRVDGGIYPVTILSVGNPHCVVARQQLDVDEMRRLGPLIERHPYFPQRTNVQFAQVVDRGRVKALIWERGAGETMASGSSACAVAAASRRAGLIDERVIIDMPGGELDVRIEPDWTIWQRGPVEWVAEMTLSDDLIARARALG
jgi:diaminopimelate epimerase